MLRKYIGRLFDNLIESLEPPKLHQREQLKLLLRDSKTILDLGCGKGSHLEGITFQDVRIIGVDLSDAWSLTARNSGIYSQVVVKDIFVYLLEQKNGSFDSVIACDLIEHLPKADGARLLNEIRRVSSNLSIVTTPNGFVKQMQSDDNSANEHLSGWAPREMLEFGFELHSGHFGLKWLRSGYGLPTLKPNLVGEFISSLTARFAFKNPKVAFQLVFVSKRDKAVER